MEYYISIIINALVLTGVIILFFAFKKRIKALMQSQKELVANTQIIGLQIDRTALSSDSNLQENTLNIGTKNELASIEKLLRLQGQQLKYIAESQEAKQRDAGSKIREKLERLENLLRSKGHQAETIDFSNWGKISFGSKEDSLVEIFNPDYEKKPRKVKLSSILNKTLMEEYLQTLLLPALDIISKQGITDFLVKINTKKGRTSFQNSLTNGILNIVTMQSKSLPSKIGKVSNKMLWAYQVLAILTQDMYYNDLTENIHKLRDDIREIKNWLDNDRFGKIDGNMSQLQYIAKKISTQLISEQEFILIKNQIEDIERESFQLVYAILHDMSSEINRFAAITEDDLDGDDNINMQLKKVAMWEKNNLEPFMYTMQTCIFVLKLKFLFNESWEMIQTRSEELGHRLEKYNDLIDRYNETISEKVHLIDAGFLKSDKKMEAKFTKVKNKIISSAKEKYKKVDKNLDSAKVAIINAIEKSKVPLEFECSLNKAMEVKIKNL